MSWQHRTIIVTAADQALAQSLCAGLAGAPGAEMFTTPMSSSGAAPATHYISSGMIEAQFDPFLTDAAAMFAAAQATAQPVTLAQCQQLVTNSTVQDADVEGPFATMARLGLKLIPARLT